MHSLSFILVSIVRNMLYIVKPNNHITGIIYVHLYFDNIEILQLHMHVWDIKHYVSFVNI